jgi:spore coat protein A, manganese oxidase
MISRRRLLQLGGMAGAAVLLPFKWNIRKAYASPGLTKFGPNQALPGLGPTGIPALTPTSTAGGVDTYNIVMGQFKQKLHPSLGETTLWGYAQDGPSPNHRYLGGAIVAKRGRPVKLIARNNLPDTHILPVDITIPGAETGQATNRAAIHLHGGLVSWTNDGGPFSWFLPGNGGGGSSFLNGGPNPGQATYFYPNDQSARLIWYHDHAVGLTRLNAYAGLASAYILRDDYEQWLINAKLIPSREIPLIIQDKSFNDDGSLFYSSTYDAEVGPGSPAPFPSVVPEFFGDTILVNGMAYPYLEVEPRIYRFRMLNGAQARFFNLQLYYADASTGTEANLSNPGPKMIQIGTEGGFLPFPVALNDPPIRIRFDPATGNANAYTLLLAPAERADVLIDFSGCNVGSKLILYNDAPSPFPGGEPPISGPGAGPDTQTLMQFRVISRQGLPDPLSLKIIPAAAVKAERFSGNVNNSLLPVVGKLEQKLALRTRDLTLNEEFDEYGRLIQFLGTNVVDHINSEAKPSFGKTYATDPTEISKAGSIEIWRIFNLTGDVHPIHFHLVNVQVLSRRPFDAVNYSGAPLWTGPARRPDLNEMGWKETVRMNPGEMTEVIMKFDLPKTPSVPFSPRLATYGINGYEYVWHCHILEHEEHDMMRPLVVVP